MLVCTLPSPACMCSATNTRLRSTRCWIGAEVVEQRPERSAREQAPQLAAHLGLPRHADRAVLQQVEDPHRRVGCDPPRELRGECAEAQRLELARSTVPAGDPCCASSHDQRRRAASITVDREPWTVAEHLGRRQSVGVRVAGLADARRAREVGLERVEQRELVPDRELDVDALDRVGVLAEPLERDHDVLVDLERVRVAGDRGGAAAVAPECLAGLGAGRDEPLAGAGVGDAHDVRRALRDRRLVVADDVAEQHHLRQRAALRAGRVADGAQVALVEVLEAGEPHAARAPAARRSGRGSRRSRESRRAPGRRTPGRPCGCAQACGARSSAPT